MALLHVGHLVGENTGQFTRIARAQDRLRMDVDVAGGSGEGIDLLVSDHVETVAERLGTRSADEALTHLADVATDHPIVEQRKLRAYLVLELVTEMPLLGDAERTAARDGDRRADCEQPPTRPHRTSHAGAGPPRRDG